MNKFFADNGFLNFNELIDFINKYKNHTCKCNCIPIKETKEYKKLEEEKNLYLKDVNIKELKKNTPEDRNEKKYKLKKYVKNIILANKINKFINSMNLYLKERKPKTFEEICSIPLPPVTDDEEILLNISNLKLNKNVLKKRKDKKETNQKIVVDEIINKLIKNLNIFKKKNDDNYNIIYEKNRSDINYFSKLYNNEILINISKKTDIKLDTNSSRLNRTCNILNYIKNNKNIYNSNYIFNYYTFKAVNMEGLDYLFSELKILCENTNTPEKEKYVTPPTSFKKNNNRKCEDYEGDDN